MVLFRAGRIQADGRRRLGGCLETGHFGWEYKGKHKDLKAAYVQLQQYSIALENLPLMVVCDMERFRIHTNWTNTVQEIHEITLDDLHEPEKRQCLKWAFSDPECLKPGKVARPLQKKQRSNSPAWRNDSHARL